MLGDADSTVNKEGSLTFQRHSSLFDTAWNHAEVVTSHLLPAHRCNSAPNLVFLPPVSIYPALVIVSAEVVFYMIQNKR